MAIIYFISTLLLLIAFDKMMTAFEYSALISDKKPHWFVRGYKGGYSFVADLVSLKVFDR